MADETRLVPAVERAVRIMDIIAADGPMILSDIARALSLPKSSVHGLCHTLCHLNLLREKSGRYSLGTRSLRWSGAAMDESSLIAEFKDLLDCTTDLQRYTVTLSTLLGDEVIYLACQNSSAPLGVSFRIGMRLPASFTATGKAMLSHLPPRDLATLLDQPFPTALTDTSVQSADALLSELELARSCGYSVDNGQVRAGMCCLGAAVLDAGGNIVAGVALSMTTAEAKAPTIEAMGTSIADFALQLSRRVGFRN
ncbi:IclR family transcriptional regulator [Falsirhodobacter sp. 1013]|uniref:IclR family transcriptional regulator n=1 Tax=Falsirhodobacter sp. 1013 TaxID=3417566 RepID=UPI003EC142F7